MAANTGIEWTDDSWNPIVAYADNSPTRGWFCEHVSEGCTNCYAETLNANRFGNGLQYIRQNHKRVRIALSNSGQTSIDWPLRTRKGRRIFVCSMTDLFGDWVPDEMIDRVFARMALAPQHTFMVLTKRAERMRWYSVAMAALAPKDRTRRLVASMYRGHPAEYLVSGNHPDERVGDLDWPLPNVWLGVSVENQEWVDKRIPLLLQTPAAVRFLSVEPLLGPVDLSDGPRAFGCGWEGGWRNCPDAHKGKCAGVDWIIVGGESGPNARPMHPDWARSIRDDCQQARVPFFFKQFGEWLPEYDAGQLGSATIGNCHIGTSRSPFHRFPDGTPMMRVGKKSAGRLLDGREWNEFPKAPHGQPLFVGG